MTKSVAIKALEKLQREIAKEDMSMWQRAQLSTLSMCIAAVKLAENNDYKKKEK